MKASDAGRNALSRHFGKGKGQPFGPNLYAAESAGSVEMEIFIETLVKKQKTAKATILRILIIIPTIILSIAAVIAGTVTRLSFFGLLLAAGIIYGAWLLMRSFNVEYEYILTNSDLDVDKIISQSRRKRLTSVDLRNIEIMAPITPDYRNEYESQGIKTKIDASTGDLKTTYFIKYASDKTGMTLLTFNPDDRIISGAKQSSPRKVFKA